jgi:pimeloyl-ACP methyl ester carboxylesterase
VKSHRITGGGGLKLHVVEASNSRGRPILFIHGFSQCWLAWSRQLSSDLADDYRLVAIDMRLMVSQISLARATLTQDCGLMTSTRSCRL